ncbi:hypothetical protein DHEL01_v204456 [Diaporthe helianthi]|uniref:Uncharacterized protein n=1 Tax=Diaporthe helianthi TaxID=158607 RepID=A0A2P5I3V3_DIAHE|nr:hypothetical protein DHEL01_v204456 [Diaporthe helianthi]
MSYHCAVPTSGGSERHGERVKVRQSAPEEFQGLIPVRIIVAAIETAAEDVFIVNTIRLWRYPPEREADAVGGLEQSLVPLASCGLAYWQIYPV